MKNLFVSLICSRDVPYFIFNWMCSRAHLDRGFHYPHLLLDDGSLEENQKNRLRSLPGIILHDHPADMYPQYINSQDPEIQHKSPYLAKLQCLQVAIKNYGAHKAIGMDCDIFFYKNWDNIFSKILNNPVNVLRDFGSSIGPHPKKYKQFFGVGEDVSTPNCNTGIFSITKEELPHLEEILKKHLSDPFLIMEDQGIFLAAYHGKLNYLDIPCIQNGTEFQITLWNWIKSKSAAHLMGMRERDFARHDLRDYATSQFPKKIHIKNFIHEKFIPYGLLEFDIYNFNHPLQKLPSTYRGEYITDAVYLHGGSEVLWKLPPNSAFTGKVVLLDSGLSTNTHVYINNKTFARNNPVSIENTNKLHIKVPDGSGSHFAILEPYVELTLEKID